MDGAGEACGGGSREEEEEEQKRTRFQTADGVKSVAEIAEFYGSCLKRC